MSLHPRHDSMAMDMDMGSMNMGMDNSTTAGMMSTAFTTSLGAANLWFSSWTPASAGATFGACLGLFFLAILSRFLAAIRACAETAWVQALRRERALASSASSTTSLTGKEGAVALPADTPSLGKSASRESSPPAFSATAPSPSSRPVQPPLSPPFILAIDMPRTLLFGFTSFVQYLLMLAVMTFDAWFFIAILLGLMGGELCFGRFVAAFGGAGAHHEGHY
ncbi:hypothetical protein JCM8097_001514 [Rhodosporidiobolus ruineniae]